MTNVPDSIEFIWAAFFEPMSRPGITVSMGHTALPQGSSLRTGFVSTARLVLAVAASE